MTTNGDPGEEAARGFARSLGTLISELRRQRGWSLEDLADEAGRHRTYFGLVERGERHLSVASAYRAAEALGISLSDLIQLAEEEAPLANRAVRFEHRTVPPGAARGGDAVQLIAGLSESWVPKAIEATHQTLDRIDEQLINTDSLPLAEILDKVNLSAIIGDLLRAALAKGSNGRYMSNEPHTYPDLISPSGEAEGLEIKIALETNKPKGHFAKSGPYLTCRYVLADRAGNYKRYERGDVVWIWEARLGELSEEDFSLSNTPGDSGKIAVIRPDSLDRLECIYFDRRFLPYAKPRPGHD